MRVVTVTNLTRDTVIGNHIQIADTSLRRMVGLLGKRSLGAGEGLWIKPSSGVHTIGMSFSIDVIGLDKNLKVIKLWPRLVPFRITSVSLKLTSVIELAAGAISDSRVELGDTLRIS